CLFRIRRVAIERALVDALADSGEAEEGEGEAEGPVVDAGKAATGAVALDIFLLARDAERLAVDATKAAERRLVRQPPLHALISDVGERMAKCRQLPVEHGGDARLVLHEDHVVEAVVAMDQRDAAVVLDLLFLKPGDQLVHVVDDMGFGRAVLAGPARELAGKVAAGLAEVAESDRLEVEVV